MRTMFISSLISIFFFGILFYFTQSLSLVVMALLLALLEITISLDNAVVNVKTLKNMSIAWRKRFIYFGLPIAVFGMRLVFPVLMVSCTTPLSFIEVIHVAMDHPAQYSEALRAGFPFISGFGGSFLLMVFFNFLGEKLNLKSLWALFLPVFIVLLIGVLISGLMFYFPQNSLPVSSSATHFSQVLRFFYAYFLGALINFLFQIFQEASKFLKSPPLTSQDYESLSASKKKKIKVFLSGLSGFLYLEFLDASFSLDGVLGAFAITENIFVIMVGLGIGALFVRSFTLWMLDHGTLQKWKYLDDGAHYAVLFLGSIMLFENFYHVPEFLIAITSVLIILAAIFLSHIKQKINKSS